MLLKIQVLIIVLAILTYVANSAHFPGYCSQCEEEIWEEVSCDQVPKPVITTTIAPPIIPPYNYIPKMYTPYVTTTTTTAAPPITTSTSTTTTLPPYSTTTTTARPPYYYTSTPTTTTARYIYTTSKPPTETSTINGEPYKQCYCECKVGCKEFCRKVIVNPDQRKQLTQISKTLQEIPYGHIETKHFHQHKFVPGSSSNSIADYGASAYSNDYSNNQISYASDPIPYSQQQQQHHQQYHKINSYPLVENSIKHDARAHAVASVYPSSKSISNNYKNYADTAIVSTDYTVDELTKLLQVDALGKTTYTNPSAIYYAPNPPPYPIAPAAPVIPTKQQQQYYAPEYYKAHASKTAPNIPPSNGPAVSNSNYNNAHIYVPPTAVAPYKHAHKTAALDYSIDRYLNNFAYAQPSSDSSDTALAVNKNYASYAAEYP